VDVDPAEFNSWPVRGAGYEIQFARDLMTDQPDRMPGVIARALVLAHMHAGRLHWRLAWELIEEPIERWEKRQRGKVGDAKLDAKLDELRAEHRGACEAETARLLHARGLDEAGRPEEE
jgi:hypothetical protein